MRTGSKVLGTLAIVGFAAVSTLFLLDNASKGSNFIEALTGVEGDMDVKFINYVGKYQKSYGTKEEFLFRMQNFAKNYQKVFDHNSKSNSSYTLGVNHMSDWTEEEFKMVLGGKNLLQARQHKPLGSFIVFNTTDLPKSVDWRPTGAVTQVKDQGKCGSCYAFSAVGSIEGQYWNLTKKTVDLSVEQVVDCSDSYGNKGCGGGLPDWVFDYVWDNGLETEADYPYGKGSGYCEDDTRKYVVGLNHYWDVTHLDPLQLKGAIANVATISIGVGAGNDAWFQYKGGIIDDIDVCKPNLDHAVLLVGYGVEDSTGREYWIVKNTWGPNWGEQGYVRILISNGYGVCGVNMTPIFPQAKLLK